jgi:hypothetical protein
MTLAPSPFWRTPPRSSPAGRPVRRCGRRAAAPCRTSTPLRGALLLKRECWLAPSA